MGENTELKDIQEKSFQEFAKKLEDGYEKRNKSLITNIAATVISAVILNVAATFLATTGTVKSNTDRINRIEQMALKESENQRELKEFVAALQVQYMYLNGDITENKTEIRRVQEKIDDFITKYYTGATRGGALPKFNKSNND